MIVRESYRDVRHRVCRAHYYGDKPLPENAPPLANVEDARDDGGCEFCHSYWLAPASDPTDRYAAGFDGNHFATRDEAEDAIETLRDLGGAFDCDWIVRGGVP